MPLIARVVGSVLTPALVFDEQQVRRDFEAALTLRDRCGCKVLCAQANELRLRPGPSSPDGQ